MTSSRGYDDLRNPRYAAYARRIWGDDALFCEFDRAWHHRQYHEHNGYETRVIPVESEFAGGHPVAPDCYLESADLIFVHRCDWYLFGGARLRRTRLPQSDGKWQVHQTSDGQLTVAPSIHCAACGLHGFFTAGAWRDC